MSYDITLNVRVAGAEHIYARVAEPTLKSPTYNLRQMFVACMDWEYNTSVKDENGVYQTCYYPCDFVLEKVNRGLTELLTKRSKYIQYNSPNGWGTIDGAIRALESLRECICETAEYLPIEHLYMAWG